MIATAESLEPAINWRLCAAEDIDLADNSCDQIVSQFGMMFFADRDKAAHEMFRILQPGGSTTIAVWQSVAANPAYADVISLLDDTVSTAAGDALRLPYCLGDHREVERILAQAGFSEISTQSLTASAKFPSLRQMVEAELRGWLPLFDIVLPEEQIKRVLDEAETRLAKHANTAGEAEFETLCGLATLYT